MPLLRVIQPTGLDDYTATLQEALDAVRDAGGGEVVLSPGDYPYADNLNIGTGTTLRGISGNLLRPLNPERGALLVEGERIQLRDLNIQGAAVKRLQTDRSMGIRVVRGKHIQIERVNVRNVAGAGMLFRHTEFFKVSGCTVEASRADGYHVTSGSAYGEVIGNFAIDTGDDCYACVGYNKDGQLVRHIVIANNVGLNGNARGVACLGGHYITIMGNNFDRLGAAGLYMAQERSYDTYAPRFVTAVGNVMRDVTRRVEHAGIYVKGNEGYKRLEDGTAVTNAIEYVTIANNLLDGALNTGVYLSSHVKTVRGSGNILQRITRQSVVDEADDSAVEFVVTN